MSRGAQWVLIVIVGAIGVAAAAWVMLGETL